MGRHGGSGRRGATVTGRHSTGLSHRAFRTAHVSRDLAKVARTRMVGALAEKRHHKAEHLAEKVRA